MINKKIIENINKYIIETKNFRNDGWVQGHYRETLKEVFLLILNSGVLNEQWLSANGVQVKVQEN